MRRYIQQTLTTLELAHNIVGPRGAAYLGSALKRNKVRHTFVHISSIFQIVIRRIDDYAPGSSLFRFIA